MYDRPCWPIGLAVDGVLSNVASARSVLLPRSATCALYPMRGAWTDGPPGGQLVRRLATGLWVWDTHTHIHTRTRTCARAHRQGHAQLPRHTQTHAYTCTHTHTGMERDLCRSLFGSKAPSRPTDGRILIRPLAGPCPASRAYAPGLCVRTVASSGR